MSNRGIYLIIGTLLVWFWVTVFLAIWHFAGPVKYDCSIASFHPDVPKNVKAKCREVKA